MNVISIGNTVHSEPVEERWRLFTGPSSIKKGAIVKMPPLFANVDGFNE